MAQSGAASPLIISSEQDAWDVLVRALDGAFQGLEPPEIEFRNWPIFVVRIRTGDGSISPSMMEGFIALQQAIYRSRTILRCGKRQLTVLTDEEKRALEFSVYVSAGSSFFKIDGTELFKTLVQQIGGKMDGRHWVIIITTLALLYFGESAFREYLSNQLEMRKAEVVSKEKLDLLESLEFLSKQETERMKILADALSENKDLPRIEEEADIARRQVLRSLPEMSESNVGGVDLDGQVAHELIRNPRRRSEEIVITGTFGILRVDTTAPDGFRVRLINLEDGTTFTAGVQDVLLSETQRRIIRQAEWAKQPIRAQIDAKIRGDQIVDATIKEVEPVPTD